MKHEKTGCILGMLVFFLLIGCISVNSALPWAVRIGKSPAVLMGMIRRPWQRLLLVCAGAGQSSAVSPVMESINGRISQHGAMTTTTNAKGNAEPVIT
jgi:hypothetical protein